MIADLLLIGLVVVLVATTLLLVHMRRRLAALARQQRLILSASPELIYLKDGAGRYEAGSDAFFAFHGLRREQVIGKTAAEAFPPPIAELIERADEQLLRADGPYYSEKPIPNSSGKPIWLDTIKLAVADERGLHQGIIGISHDITARKEAEIALTQQLRFAQAIARCAQVLLVATSRARVDDLRDAAQLVREAVGATRVAVYRVLPSDDARVATGVRLLLDDQDPALPVHDHVVVDREALADELGQVFTSGAPFGGPVEDQFENLPTFRRYLQQNGVRSSLLVPFELKDGYFGHLAVSDHYTARAWDEASVQFLRTAADLFGTYVKAAEAWFGLREREAQIRSIGDNLPNGMIYQTSLGPDGDFRYSYVSAGSERLLGVTPDQVFAQPKLLREQILEADRARFDAATRASALNLTDYAIELRQYTLAGKLRWMQLASTPRRLADGTTVWDGIQLDITETRQAAEALMQAKEAAEAAARARASFLAHMSHEIRTPLNAVLGMADLLSDTPLSDEQRGMVRTIYTAGSALLGVINNILDFSKHESGELLLEQRPFALRDCLDDAVDLVRSEARRKGLGLSCTVDPQLPQRLIGDSARIRQVLVNLLANAVKFTERGSVVVEVRPSTLPDGSPALSIAVCDTGIGISAEQQQRLFLPFTQADSSTTRRYGGTGLGLAICRQLVEAMGGHLELRSAAGAGSTFTATLPLRSPDANERLGPNASARVLLVEDNPVSQAATRLMLARLGCAVETVADAPGALAALEQGPFDIVLLDLALPEGASVAFARTLRARHPGPRHPWLLAHGTRPPVGEEAALFDGFLGRPVQREQLLAVLERIGAA